MNKSILKKTWPYLVIGLLVFLAYSNILYSPFVFDDLIIIERIKSVWPDNVIEYGLEGNRKLFNLTMICNFAVSGEKVMSYHIVSILIHIGACCFLYLLLKELSGLSFIKVNDMQREYIPLLIVLLWGLHPLQTQSVTYISQRSEVMIGLFAFSMLYFLLKGGIAEKGKLIFYGLSLLMCLFGVLSKEAMLGTVAVIPFFDYCFMSRSLKKMFLRRWGFYSILFILPLGFIIFRFNAVVLRAFNAVPEVSPMDYFLTQSLVVFHYIYLAFYPVKLCFDYIIPFISDWKLALPYLLVLAAMLAVTIYFFFKKPHIGFWMVFFFVNLAPRSSFAPRPDAVVEHRMYLPLLGIILISFFLFFTLYRFLIKRYQDSTFKINYGFCSLGVAVILTLTVLTFKRNKVYESLFTLWNDTVVKFPHNSRALNNLGSEYFKMGEYRKAEECFRKALDIHHASHFAHSNLANTLASLKLYEEAEMHARKSIGIHVGYTPPYIVLGSILKDTGRLDEALEIFGKAIELEPGNATILANIGAVYRNKDDWDRAAYYYLKALDNSPAMIRASLELGLIYMKVGKYEQAEVVYLNALKYRRNSPDLYFRLGLVAMQKENYDNAVRYFQNTLLLDPEFPQVKENYAQANALRGNVAKAIRFYENLIEKNRSDYSSHKNLGVIFLNEGEIAKAEKHFMKALELKPDLADALKGMGSLYYMSDLFPEAESYYLKAIEIVPNDPSLYNNIGSVFAKQRKYQQAADAYRRAIEIKPDYVEAKMNLENVLKKLNKPR